MLTKLRSRRGGVLTPANVHVNPVGGVRFCAGGPELPGEFLDHLHIRPRTDRADHLELFNGSLRDECLNTNWFTSLEDAQEKIERWKKVYNRLRPHSAPTHLTPEEFARESRALAI